MCAPPYSAGRCIIHAMNPKRKASREIGHSLVPQTVLWLQAPNRADDNADLGNFVCEITLSRDYHAEHRL